jgi:hypothetical protein
MLWLFCAQPLASEQKVAFKLNLRVPILLNVNFKHLCEINYANIPPNCPFILHNPAKRALCSDCEEEALLDMILFAA